LTGDYIALMPLLVRRRRWQCALSAAADDDSGIPDTPCGTDCDARGACTWHVSCEPNPPCSNWLRRCRAPSGWRTVRARTLGGLRSLKLCIPAVGRPSC